MVLETVSRVPQMKRNSIKVIYLPRNRGKITHRYIWFENGKELKSWKVLV